MDLRVIARVREIDEDTLLREISEEISTPPSDVSFVWRKKYIKVFDVDSYWELEKDKKTVINYCDGTVDVIREKIDNFAKRLDAERKRSRDEMPEPDVEEGIEMEFEEDGEEE